MATIRTTESRHAAGSGLAALAAVVARTAAAAWTVLRNRRQMTRISELDDHLLADIGLTRGDLETASLAPLTADPTVQLARIAESRRPRGRRGDGYPRDGRYY